MITRSGGKIWRELLQQHKPLLLPAAHDALTAKIMEEAGLPAYQVGGFALDGARYGLPDIDLNRFGEKSAIVQDIIAASKVPVLVDIDDGYGDVKNVTHTIQRYEAMGVSAVFIEDQKPPKRCGHMSGKQVIPKQVMVEKIQAACQARSNREALFVIARTDAIADNGLRDALDRGEAYLKAGADAIYLEGPTSVKQMEEIGRIFRAVPQVANILEGGGKTPWVAPDKLAEMGFAMVLYPTSILFRVAKTIKTAVNEIKQGHPMLPSEAVSMDEFEEMVGIRYWRDIENRYQHSQEYHLGMKQWVKHSLAELFKKAS